MSRLTNWAIGVPFLYSQMKVMGRNMLKTSLEEKGYSWDGYVKELAQQQKELEAIKAELEDTNIEYPPYYLVPFHAYDQGNLCWQAAFEVEPASYAMAVRTFPDMERKAAFDRLRDGITTHIKDYMSQHGCPSPRSIVDLGCSVGVSTRLLAKDWPLAQVTGIDLSPYFLAVAEAKERASREAPRRIQYLHRRAESTGLASGSQELVTATFVIHECPDQPIRDFIAEGKRLLKPGGVMVFTDNNPRSKTIQNLPPFVRTIMKSTEPHSDAYYSFDLEGAMREGGLVDVVRVETDHRHAAVMGRKP